MDRLDARTASFFTIGFLVLSFGCKSGAALHALGAGAVTAAKVATVVAAGAAASGSGPSREGGVERAAPRDRACQVVCPSEEGYVCATAVVTVDAATNRDRIVYECDGPLALR